jgi:hypothetical protein
MEQPRDTNPPSVVNDRGDRQSEPYLGGADAVEKTADLGDVHGADAHAERASGGVTATVHHDGPSPLVWVVLVLVVLVVLAYAIGLVA